MMERTRFYTRRSRRNPVPQARETRSILQRVREWAFGARRIEVHTNHFSISAPSTKDVEDVLAILAQHDASKLGVDLGAEEDE